MCGRPPVRVEWRRAEAASLPLPDGAFDVVCCQQGLQFFADRLLALREARRVLAPGGRVALAVWRAIHHNPVYAAFAQVLQRHAGAETAALMEAPFAGGELLSAQAASSPLGAPLAALDGEVRDALARDLDQTLEEWADDDGVVFPLQTWLASARR